MPTLNWIGKEAVEHHHRDVPYRLIHCDGDLSAGDPDAGNLLVQGDNLEALKALLPCYGGQVKCICSIPDDHIDPRRSSFLMARSVLRDIWDGVQRC